MSWQATINGIQGRQGPYFPGLYQRSHGSTPSLQRRDADSTQQGNKIHLKVPGQALRLSRRR